MEMKTNIKEYSEGMDVEIVVSPIHNDDRLVIRAYNEGGYNHTDIDLLDVLKFVKKTLPELSKKCKL